MVVANCDATGVTGASAKLNEMLELIGILKLSQMLQLRMML